MSTEEMPRLTRLKIDAIKVPPIRLSSELTEEERGEFEDSIRWDGIMNPIQVIEDPQGNFWLADGGNRLEVARKLGQEVVPVIVRLGTVEDAIVGSAVMNLKRGRVNPGLLAEFIRHLADKFNWTLEEIAEKLRLSKSHVSTLHSIARDKNVLEELKAGKLTVREAYERAKAVEQKGPAHSSTVELCSAGPATHQSPPLRGEGTQPVVEGAGPVTDEDIFAGSRGLYKTKLELCGYCGRPVAKEVAKRIFVHAHEYDRALLALEKARAEEDHAKTAPQTPQAEGGGS
jgi:ParB/RepB/Spo0J family partition protein